MTLTTADRSVVDLFRIIDAMDAAGFAKAFAEDGTFRFGNDQPAVGRQQIEKSVSAFFSTIQGLRHEITGVWSGTWEGGTVTSVEAQVTYTRKDETITEPLP
jgi:hypothetical protein